MNEFLPAVGFLVIAVLFGTLVTFFARAICAIFSKRSRGYIRAHPIAHILWLVVSLVIVLGVDWVPPSLIIQSRALAVREVSDLKQVGLLLQEYAENHTGRYPPALSAVFSDDTPKDIQYFKDPKTRVLHDWFYCPGHTASDPSGTILAFSPVYAMDTSKSQKRIVLFFDLSASIMAESEFVVRFKKQMHPMKVAPASTPNAEADK